MKQRFGSRFTLLFAAAAALAACNSSTPDEDEETVEEAPQAVVSPDNKDGAAEPKQDRERGKKAKRDRGADRGADHIRGHGPRGGPEMLLFGALREEIGLSDDQRTAIQAQVDGMHDRGDKGDRAKRDKGPEHGAALAAAIRSGTIDVAALKGGDVADDHEAKHAERRTKLAAALTSLHATLTPAQRSALVTKLQERIDERPDHPALPGGKGGPGMPGGRGGRGGPPNVTEHVLRGIELKDGQRESIESAIAAKLGAPPAPPTDEQMKSDHEARVAADKALLAAFTANRFDAAASMPEMGPPKHMKGRGGRPQFLEALAVAVPMLDADQREALAVKMESGPPEHRGGKRHRRGR